MSGVTSRGLLSFAFGPDQYPVHHTDEAQQGQNSCPRLLVYWSYMIVVCVFYTFEALLEVF